MAPRAGLEPATLRLTAGCSTIELSGNADGQTRDLLYISQASWAANPRPRPSEPADVDAVLRPRGIGDLDRPEARLAEHAARELLAPGRAEPRAALGQRDRHAVKHAHPIDVRSEGIADILLQPARGLGLLHEVDAVRREGAGDPAQYRRGIALVVDGIEGRDQVELGLGLELRDVEHLEAGVPEPHLAGLGPRPGDCVLAEIVADEARRRVLMGHHIDGVAGAAPNVRHADARLQALGQALGSRQEALDQEPIIEQPPRGVHRFGEVGPVFRIGHAAAIPERLNDAREPLAEHGQALAAGGEIAARRSRQAGRVLGRERERAGGRVVLDDAARRHGGQPLANVALIEPGPIGDLSAGPGTRSGGLEEARLMPDMDEEREDPARVMAEELPREVLNALTVELRLHGSSCVRRLSSSRGGPRAPSTA